MKLSDIKNEAFVGLLLNIGNAGVCWSETHIASGVAALILGSIPVIFMLFNWLGFEKKVPHVSSLFAILLGVVGIALISSDNDMNTDWRVVLVLLLANCSWVMGSLRLRTTKSHLSYFPRAAVQLISGGTFLICFSSLFEDSWSFSLVTYQGIGSVLFLALVGTVLAYTAYSFVLKNVSTELASTYALVNPLVALFLGIFFLGEVITPQATLATVLILLSVVLTLYGNKLWKPQLIRVSIGRTKSRNE